MDELSGALLPPSFAGGDEMKIVKVTWMRTCRLASMLFALAANAVGEPLITTQPQDQTNYAGTTATFTVAATGTGFLHYQWQKYAGGFMGLADETNTSLTLINVQTNDAADYRVLATDATGTTNSVAVHLWVVMPGTLAISQPTPDLVTLSWQGDMGLVETIMPTSGSLDCALWFRVPGVSPVTLPVRAEPRFFRLIALPPAIHEHALNQCRSGDVRACEDCIQDYFLITGLLPASSQMEEADSIGAYFGSCFCVEARLAIEELNVGIQPQR
jgi:Immunoglobulin I-set domain